MPKDRDDSLEHLHPVVREKVKVLLQKLSAEKLPFRVFEGFRTPQRQQSLYDQGRTKPGDIVTKARPWLSNHQYGVAADFVLYLKNGWSWEDSGEKAQWWERLHELAGEVGLKPLSWETPHLELVDVSTESLKAGHYPAGGDQSWAENLAEAIYNWTGSPAAPPLPGVLPTRPPIETQAVTVEEINGTIPMGASDWHSKFGGQEWRYDARGIFLRDYGDGREPLRTPGEPITCRKIMQLCGEEILAASKHHQVPMALIIMTIATETAFARKLGFTGPRTFRWEAGVEVTDIAPHLWGDYSAGPMQTLATTARWVIRTQRLDYDPFKVAPVYEYQPDPPEEHPLYDYATNIDIGTAEIKQRWTTTGDDPILVAAAFNAGGLYESEGNPWGLHCHGDHLNRAAEWYGDACAVLEELKA